MAAAGRKITYTAAEVAELIRPLTQSVEALQKENTELKQKLEHMNEILANAQRARFGQSSEKRSYVLSEGHRHCPYHYHQNAASSYEALSGISLYCGRCYDEEVCGRSSSGPAGEDLGETGCGTEPGHHPWPTG